MTSARLSGRSLPWLISRKPDLIVNERVKRDLGLGDYAVAESGIPAEPMARQWERCSLTKIG